MIVPAKAGIQAGAGFMRRRNECEIKGECEVIELLPVRKFAKGSLESP